MTALTAATAWWCLHSPRGRTWRLFDWRCHIFGPVHTIAALRSYRHLRVAPLPGRCHASLVPALARTLFQRFRERTQSAARNIGAQGWGSWSGCKASWSCLSLGRWCPGSSTALHSLSRASALDTRSYMMNEPCYQPDACCILIVRFLGIFG